MENLKRYIENYSEQLIDGFVQAGIIKVVESSNEGQVYQLAKLVQLEVENGGVLMKEKEIVQSFYDFRNTMTLVYQNLKFVKVNWGQGVKLSDIIKKYIELGVFDPNWKNVSLLLEFLDKADNYLQDKEIKSSFFNLLEKYKVNFNSLILGSLKFITEDSFKVLGNQVLKDNNGVSGKSRVHFDFMILNGDKKTKIFVQVKYRNKRYSFKELIQQGIEIIKDFTSGKVVEGNIHFLSVVFSNSNSDEIERLKFKYLQELENGYEEFLGLLHFAPISTSNLPILFNEIKEISDAVWSDRSVFASLVSKDHVGAEIHIDDNSYGEILDLNKYSYNILVAPDIKMNYWRFGVRFSSSPQFASLSRRHQRDSILFHMTKNIESDILYLNLYNEKNELEYFVESDIVDYVDQLIVIKLKKTVSDYILNLTDFEGRSIMGNVKEVHGLRYAQIVAWADNVNKFSFEITVQQNSI